MFEATIDRIRRTEPESPALLNAQLAYASLLLGRASGPACEARLDRAQEQIGSVELNPDTRILFPPGWGLLADLEYRQHLARADCGPRADGRDELLAAMDAARRAVQLYRDAFDYHSMVVMQFDAATALRAAGEKSAAIAALHAALQMDREYGFRDDARENYQLPLAWRGEPDGAAQVAALMQDFPVRRATLRFGWDAGEARITLERRREFLEDGRVFHSCAAATFERHIARNRGGGWSVSYTHRVAHYEPGVWPSERVRAPQVVFPPAQFPATGLKVSATGELEGLTDAQALSARLTSRASRLIRAGASSRGQSPGTIDRALKTATDFLSPGMLAAEAVQRYQLQTAMWIGAKLDQGVWYRTTGPLSLPGMPRLAVKQRIEFAFTRRVPCTPGAASQACIEIVMHATPDRKALGYVLEYFSPAARTPFLDYDASTEARIVVDPATLLAYALEEHIHWYASVGKGKRKSILESERLVSRTRYGGLEPTAGGAGHG